MDRQLTRKEIRKSRFNQFNQVSSLLIVFILINILFRMLLSLPNQIKTGSLFYSIPGTDSFLARNNTIISITVPATNFLLNIMPNKKFSVGHVLKFSVTRHSITLEIALSARKMDLFAFTFQKQTKTATLFTQNPNGIQFS